MTNMAAALREAADIHAEAGTDVRCPTCNAAAGKFCRDGEGNSVHHTERQDLSPEWKARELAAERRGDRNN